MGAATVLLADDEDTLRVNLAQVLREEGLEVIACRNGAEALSQLKVNNVDAVITDLRMPGITGMQLIEHVRKLAPDATIIVITAFGEVETAVQAMKQGASDYLCKPLNFDEVIFKLKRLLAQNDLRRQNQLLRDQLRRTQPHADIVARSPAMIAVLETLKRVAQTMSSVLICGESGTGKEVLARVLHHGGVTRDGPFVAVNCGGLVESLIESELFGHRRGSFTGADADRIGYFEAADAGTLFLDEIGNLPLKSQSVLLRAIEEKTVTRVGDSRPRRVNIRIVAATHHELEQAVEAGTFREDLYYRLNVVGIRIAPLRQRPEDIPALVEHFVRKYNAELNCRCPGFDADALQAMLRHAWRGNVRELENVTERALIFAGDRPVGVQDLSIGNSRGNGPTSLPTDLRSAAHEFERQHIIRVLAALGGNKAAAAEALAIGLSSLYRKLEDFGVLPAPPQPPASPDLQPSARP